MSLHSKPQVNVFWFRRDLRIHDNAGLYHALKDRLPVLPVFIFDPNILDKLEDKDDARVTFIHQSLADLNAQLNKYHSSVLIKHHTPEKAWQEILEDYAVNKVYTNHDYEPYARERDKRIETLLKTNGVDLLTYKDHVIFDKDEIVKDNGTPYTVFTPYKRKWLTHLQPELHFKTYETGNYTDNFYQHTHILPALQSLGFTPSRLSFPDKNYKSILEDYSKTRDYPAINGTSGISIHLRFGTLNIRGLAKDALAAKEHTWLSELIWRDFYAMILWHFPLMVNQAFKPAYDNIKWRNNEAEFKAWCEGTTGYPMVDAGIRQLNATGWMHNRVRMITASFLTKHLLIDWRWGEAYFARKLLDYDQASNVGGWQWAASSGNDAVPYFRIFNPDLQVKRFDPKLEYIKRWVPEFTDPFAYPNPIITHKEARERALKEFKIALSG